MTTGRAVQTLNPRLAEVFNDVIEAVAHLIRKRRVTYEEYCEAIGFPEEVTRQGELPLLLDVFLAVAVDDASYEANGGTESNVEGPSTFRALQYSSRRTRFPVAKMSPGTCCFCREL